MNLNQKLGDKEVLTDAISGLEISEDTPANKNPLLPTTKSVR